MSIEKNDREIAELLKKEEGRQETTLNLIASENIADEDILKANGSILTNKYAEGYPGSRYYGGCENIDEIEKVAIKRAKKLFKTESANVQPHSGSQANAAVYLAALKPGDKIMGLDLSSGGHLTHGMSLNSSGIFYQPVFYQTENGLIDIEKVAEIAIKERPKMIIAGGSAYPRKINFDDFKEIANQINALLLADISHISGFVATGLHPYPDADFITTTTHKTLGGPRGGLILTKKDWSSKINRAVFPGQQGGPAMHSIAGKAIAFKKASEDPFRERMVLTLQLARELAEILKDEGIELVSGGTDNHLVLINLSNLPVKGKEGQEVLERIGIVSNKNSIPKDTRPPQDPSGLRLGTVALATRGIKLDEIQTIGKIIARQLKKEGKSSDAATVTEIARAHPIYQ